VWGHGCAKTIRLFIGVLLLPIDSSTLRSLLTISFEIANVATKEESILHIRYRIVPSAVAPSRCALHQVRVSVCACFHELHG
jgi:hypothetical protein